jgi:hypothetical protein
VAGDGLSVSNNGTLSEKSITISAEVDKGLDIDKTTKKIGHTNSITAGTVQSEGLTGSKFKIPKITYDDYGHITSASTTEVNLSGITDSISELDKKLDKKIDDEK